ncbi:MAG: hypothetical protein A3F17_08210 [Gammaproteobacteria bacterium RIFCSPHIGHO2_12_FULL_41_15]|nr:MAG: hypothetical protein A3F17_08210 [Gammaproteobacteria bacterium RIFCSPHIGHO2_12_FULL_41_15]
MGFFLPLYGFSHHGFYVGGLMGFGSVDYSNYSFPTQRRSTLIKDAGFAPAIQMGYDFTRITALEFGAIYFRKVVFYHLTPQNNARFKNNVAYLVSKINFLHHATMHFFVKGGLGYVVRNAVIVDCAAVVSGGGILRPIYGAGVHWQLATHWDLEMTWLQAAKQVTTQLPFSNFLGLGVHYDF